MLLAVAIAVFTANTLIMYTAIRHKGLALMLQRIKQGSILSWSSERPTSRYLPRLLPDQGYFGSDQSDRNENGRQGHGKSEGMEKQGLTAQCAKSATVQLGSYSVWLPSPAIHLISPGGLVLQVVRQFEHFTARWRKGGGLRY